MLTVTPVVSVTKPVPVTVTLGVVLPAVPVFGLTPVTVTPLPALPQVGVVVGSSVTSFVPAEPTVAPGASARQVCTSVPPLLGTSTAAGTPLRKKVKPCPAVPQLAGMDMPKLVCPYASDCVAASH